MHFHGRFRVRDMGVREESEGLVTVHIENTSILKQN